MRKVIFDFEVAEGTCLVIYPDDISFFANSDLSVPGKHICDYSGEKDLTDYIPPEDPAETTTG